MTTYAVTRHDGAKLWLNANIKVDTYLNHLDTGILRKNDVVVGMLPVHTVAQLGELGVRYMHLAMETPEHLRGQELTADQMHQNKARLVEIRASIIH
jgi:CRISPR-associated protein Csx16